MVNFLNNYAVTLLAIVALTVLTAMGKLDSNVAVPLIAGLAGVHAGANIGGTPTTVEPPKQTSTTVGP